MGYALSYPLWLPQPETFWGPFSLHCFYSPWSRSDESSTGNSSRIELFL